MNRSGFYLSKLVVIGNDVIPADIQFFPGLNVISGPSDTGKSYIFNLLNFMLGAENPPEYISESKGYSECFLEIKTYTGGTYTIKRSISKSAPLAIGQCSVDSREKCEQWKSLAPKHSADDENNISRFLLRISGIRLAKLRINKNNKTRTVSFRDFVNFIMVSEERIITRESLILSGESVRKTAEKSLFQFLLTGDDSSNLTEIGDPKLRAANIQGKIDVLKDMAREIARSISEEDKSSELESRLALLNRQIDAMSDQISQNSEQIRHIMAKRQSAWDRGQEASSRIIALEELSARFTLLDQHYRSDLERLNFIVEGEHYLSQLNTVACPVCGAKYHDHELTCLLGKENSEEYIAASYVESEKINRHLRDLNSTIMAIEDEKLQLRQEVEVTRKLILGFDTVIKEQLSPVAAVAKKELQTYIEERQLLNEINRDRERLNNLYKQIHLLENELKKKPKGEEQQPIIQYEVLEDFCNTIGGLLESWSYGKNIAVNYDSQRGDIEISGKARASHGKGYRAIVYAAFIMGLMKYMMGRKLPHPGFVVLDSPLTTYRERDESGEEVPDNIQRAFFKNLAKDMDHEQFIILENKEPIDMIKPKMNYIHFTKIHGKGRYGFFPIRN